MRDYLAFMERYAPGINSTDKFSVLAYVHANMVAMLLRRCGDKLTRENVLEQATHLRNVPIPMLLDGITLNTSPDDYSPIKQLQLERFSGTSWVPVGGITGG